MKYYFILLLTHTFLEEGDLNKPKFDGKVSMRRQKIVPFKSHTQILSKNLYFSKTH